MKLVIVGPAFPLRGGIAHHVYRLNKILQDRGHTTQTISYSRLYPRFLFPGKTMQDLSRETLDVDALQILDSMNPGTWIRAVRTIQRLEPAIVLFEWWTPILAPVIGTVARLLRRSGLKCVFECHNVFPHEPTLLDFPMVQYGLSAADAFIAFSRQNVRYLREYFPDTTSLYTHLPAPFSFRGGAGRTGTTILFFGVVRPYKGLDVLLQAMPTVLTEVKCNLIVAGEFYEAIDKYDSMIRRYGLEPFVQVNDRYVPNEEIEVLLEKADVLALPYRDATQSGVLRMALSSGMPVVASEVGAFADEVLDNVNGLLVKAGDRQSLAAALIKYFKEGLGPKFARNIRLADRTGDAHELPEIIESLASSAR